MRGLTIEDARELYGLRKSLETLMVERVMDSMRNEDIALAEALHAEMAETTDVSRWTELNIEFHAALWASQSDTRLAHLIKSLRDASGPYIALSIYMKPEHIERSNAEHQKMLDEYKARDMAAVKRHTVDHLDATLSIIVKAIEQVETEKPD